MQRRPLLWKLIDVFVRSWSHYLSNLTALRYSKHLDKFQFCNMPYVLVSTLVRLESGPTVVGDEQSDRDLMEKLGAELIQHKGCPFKEYTVQEPPRVVLNKLEKLGYMVLNTSGIGQTLVWTLHKPLEKDSS